MAFDQPPMRVAMVFMTYPVASETFAQRDVKALQRLGCEVDIHQLNPRVSGRVSRLLRGVMAMLTFPAPGNLVKLLCTLLLQPGWRIKDRFKALALVPAAALTGKRILASKPQVVHLFWGHFPSLVALLISDRLPASCTSMFLGAYDLEMKLPISRRAFACTQVLFTHAQANVAAIRAFLGTSAQPVVVHRGIDLEPYPQAAASSFGARPLQVFTAGRLIADKGFDRVIRAFARVHDACPAARLVIAGTGPEMSRLQQLGESLGLAGAISFLGWLSEEQVREQLFRSRVFVLLSTKAGERLPNAVKEAMAAGCVCVSSDSPGIDELLEHGRTGFVFAADDEQAVIDSVVAGLDDAAAPIGAAAAQSVRSGFDVNVSAGKYLKLWCAKDKESNE
ncbi:glycosyltransferase family 4 protein [Pseudomonas sichuanensis]|uniref:glycosyltransferase family 4 protein n=1 Tax=Pseudomonas TaxID=286 RepID=UPI0036EDBE84